MTDGGETQPHDNLKAVICIDNGMIFDSIAAAAIQDLSDFILNNSVIIGSDNGSACTGIKSAKVLGQSTTDYDLS